MCNSRGFSKFFLPSLHPPCLSCVVHSYVLHFFCFSQPLIVSLSVCAFQVPWRWARLRGPALSQRSASPLWWSSQPAARYDKRLGGNRLLVERKLGAERSSCDQQMTHSDLCCRTGEDDSFSTLANRRIFFFLPE